MQHFASLETPASTGTGLQWLSSEKCRCHKAFSWLTAHAQAACWSCKPLDVSDTLVCVAALHRTCSACLTRLYTIRDILYEMRTRLLADAKQQVEGLLSMEKEQTWTQNDEYFSTSKEKYLSQLVARQLLQANSEDASDEDDWYFDDEELDRFVELMGDAGVTLTAEDLKKAAAKNGQTVQAQDAGLLELIAGAQAYFEVRLTLALPMQTLIS